MSYYLKYTEEGRETKWFIGKVSGWKLATMVKLANGIKREAGEMLDVLQMRNEDIDP